jgi:hypothetical protein
VYRNGDSLPAISTAPRNRRRQKAGGLAMALFLDTIYFNRQPADKVKQALANIHKNLTSGTGLPKGVTLKAGPWYSNEELKLVVVLDMQDHSLTYGAFSNAVASGMVEKRKLEPIVEWSSVEAFIKS